MINLGDDAILIQLILYLSNEILKAWKENNFILLSYVTSWTGIKIYTNKIYQELKSTSLKTWLRELGDLGHF